MLFDDIDLYIAKAAARITEWQAEINAGALEGDEYDCLVEKTAKLIALLEQVQNTTLTQAQRTVYLSKMINLGNLLDIGTPSYIDYQSVFNPAPAPILHNSLGGLNVGDFQHLTQAEKAALFGKANLSDITFANLLGAVNDNAALVAALAGKENSIANGLNGRFFAWDKTWRQVSFNSLSGTPTTLAGYGILVGDTLFDAKYLQSTSTLTGLSITGGAITSSSTVLGAFGALQAQINAIISGGTGLTSVGLNGISGLIDVNFSPLTANGSMSLALASQTQLTVFSAPTGGNGTPSFQALVNAHLPNSGVTAGTYGSATQVPQITVNSKGVITSVTPIDLTLIGTGTVTSVALALPGSTFSVTSPPVTTTGTLNATFVNQLANRVFAGPTTGSAATPTWRVLVEADIPTLSISKINLLQSSLDAKLSRATSPNFVAIGNPSGQLQSASVNGDLSVVSAGATSTWTIGAGAVTYAKMQNTTAGQVLLGRFDSVAGVIQQITIGAGLTLNTGTGVLTATGGGGSVTWGSITGTLSDQTDLQAALDAKAATGAIGSSGLTMSTSRFLARLTAGTGAVEEIATNRIPLFPSAITGTANSTTYLRGDGSWQAVSGVTDGDKGDITVSSSGATWTIDNRVVTYAKIQNVAANSFLANATGSDATVQEIATNRIPLFASAITGTPSGTTFLRGDGTWAVPSGGGSSVFSDLTAATATNTINNANFLQEWQWNSMSSGALSLTSTSTAASGGSTFFNVGVSGANGSAAITTYAAKISNTRTGTAPFNVALQLNATTSGGTATALEVTAGQVLFNGTGSLLNMGANPVRFNSGTGIESVSSGILALAFASQAGGGSAINNYFQISTVSTTALPTPIFETAGSDTNITMQFRPKGTGAFLIGGNSTATELRLLEPSGSGTNYTGFVAPALAANVIYTLPTADGTSGQVLSTNGAGVLSWVAGGGGSGDMTLAGVQTVTGAKTFNSGTLLLRNAADTFSTTLATAATASRTYTIPEAGAAANFVMTEGARTINGATTFGAGLAATPQTIFAPSALSGLLTGTTNGSMWYDTTTGNSSLYLYKDTGLTKFITLDRNPDFALGSSAGVIVADANGTLTKSADLNALGIFAQTSTVTVANTAASTSLLGTLTGSSTLPANFFGVGKTITLFVSGTFGCASGSPTCDLLLTVGGVNVGTISLTHNNSLSGRYFEANFAITCRTIGVSGTLQFCGSAVINHSGTDDLNFYQLSTTSGAINTTGTLAVDLRADWSAADPANSITASIVYANYLN